MGLFDRLKRDRRHDDGERSKEMDEQMGTETEAVQSRPEAPAAAAPAAAAPEAAAAIPGSPGAGSTDAGSASVDAIREEVIAQLRTIFDPEIPVNIYELGLIYGVDVADTGETRITMTLTTPMCPAAEELPPEVETKARGVEGVSQVQLDLVWDPPWSPDMMSEGAKLELGML